MSSGQGDWKLMASTTSTSDGAHGAGLLGVASSPGRLGLGFWDWARGARSDWCCYRLSAGTSAVTALRLAHTSQTAPHNGPNH